MFAKYHPQPQIAEKNLIFTDNQKKEQPNSMIIKVAKTRSAYLGPACCMHTLYIRGLVQRQDAVQPHAVSLSLPLGVHAVTEGPARGLRCPQCWTCRALHPGPPSLLRAYAPSLSSPHATVLVPLHVVMPNAKRPHAVDAHRGCGPEVSLPPTLPRPFFSLLGVESPSDLVWMCRFPVAAKRRLLHWRVGGGGGGGERAGEESHPQRGGWGGHHVAAVGACLKG